MLPLAVDRETVVEGTRGGDEVFLVSDDAATAAAVSLPVDEALDVESPWARHVAAVVSLVRPTTGLSGRVSTTLPLGAGLSSSAALGVAVALAVGSGYAGVELARLCQEAEQRATGVPCGIMDQLASIAGVEGHALLVDCRSLEIVPLPLPDGLDIVVVDSGHRRALRDTPYADRRAQCEAAETEIGPLRDAALDDVAHLVDPVLRRRARHVVTENERVRQAADALVDGRVDLLGPILTESHESLRDDFEVSLPVLDELVRRLRTTPGVLGARLTGAGFGGCVVALAERGAAVPGRRLRAATGASVAVS